MQAKTATTNIHARDFVAGIRGFPSLASTACVSSFSPRWHTSHTTAYCLSETHLNTYQTWLTLYCSIRRKLRSLSQTGQCLLSCGPRSATPPLEPHTNISSPRVWWFDSVVLCPAIRSRCPLRWSRTYLASGIILRRKIGSQRELHDCLSPKSEASAGLNERCAPSADHRNRGNAKPARSAQRKLVASFGSPAPSYCG